VIDAGLTHRDVAQRLSMTQVDVTRCLAKLRQCRPDQVGLAQILATLEQWRVDTSVKGSACHLRRSVRCADPLATKARDEG
jgi:hypothetical protein